MGERDGERMEGEWSEDREDGTRMERGWREDGKRMERGRRENGERKERGWREDGERVGGENNGERIEEKELETERRRTTPDLLNNLPSPAPFWGADGRSGRCPVQLEPRMSSMRLLGRLLRIASRTFLGSPGQDSNLIAGADSECRLGQPNLVRPSEPGSFL